MKQSFEIRVFGLVESEYQMFEVIDFEYQILDLISTRDSKFTKLEKIDLVPKAKSCVKICFLVTDFKHHIRLLIEF